MRDMMNLKKMIKAFEKKEYNDFDKFYQLTERQVYFSIYSIVKSNDVTADLMQETYMKFLEKIDQYNPKYSVKTYLNTIARNLAINYYNKAKKDIHSEEILSYIPSSDSVDEKVLILDLLDLLDQDKRYIVTMHVINGYKFREIADMMQMKLGTVQWHYHEAMKFLKEKVGDI